MSLLRPLEALLAPYQRKSEAKIAASIESLGPPSELRDACAYALQTGGKRFRPALVYIMAEALGKNRAVDEAALAVELFHTASLIADDLPCMDDEEMRRGKPTVHHKFGEATALLATYALIAAGYDCLRKNALDPKVLPAALESAAFTTGLFGATGGQFLDLYPPKLDEEALTDIVQKKTGALFELSFVLGWLYGGGELEKLPLVKKGAGHFGRAFQIVDDFVDLPDDLKAGRKINYPALLGVERAQEILQQELKGLTQAIDALALKAPALHEMVQFLHTSAAAPVS